MPADVTYAFSAICINGSLLHVAAGTAAADVKVSHSFNLTAVLLGEIEYF